MNGYSFPVIVARIIYSLFRPLASIYLACAVGRVPPVKRSIKPGAAPFERHPMSFLFAAAMACVILPILAGPALRIFAPALARRA